VNQVKNLFGGQARAAWLEGRKDRTLNCLGGRAVRFWNASRFHSALRLDPTFTTESQPCLTEFNAVSLDI